MNFPVIVCLKHIIVQLNRDSPTLRYRGGVGLPKMSDYQRLALHMYLIEFSLVYKFGNLVNHVFLCNI